MKSQWLDRGLTVCALYYCLCLTEKEYLRQLKHCKIPETKAGPFSHEWGDAGVFFYQSEGKYVALVCMDQAEIVKRELTGVQIAAILAHEAVHIWQKHARLIGSFNDHGDEEEAYAIQTITQSLLQSYRDQVFGKE